MQNEKKYKTMAFQLTLAKHDLSDCFIPEDNEEHSVFTLMHSIGSARCPIYLVVDDSNYNMIYCHLARLVESCKTDNILKLINELNERYKPTSFYMNDANEIICKLSYIANSETFDGMTFLSLLFSAVEKICAEVYGQIMQEIWS